jgi:hypothetical protein
MKKIFLLIVPILFFAGCELNKKTTLPEKQITLEKQTQEDITLSKFFMNDNSTAQFKGEGNEFTSYTLKTRFLFDDYIATYEDNGGTVIEKIYRIFDDHIGIIARNAEVYEPKIRTLEELKAMPELEIYLGTPLKVGNEFEGWKVISTSEIVKSNSNFFEDVIVIEKKDGQNTIERKYFAKDFGEIKREFTMTTNGKQSVASSTFEKIIN